MSVSLKKTLAQRYLQFWLFKPIVQTHGTAAPIRLSTLILQKCIGFNRSAYWPMHHSSTISGARSIEIGVGCAPGLSSGCYLNGSQGIKIGDYTLVAPNVGIITTNHDILNLKKNVPSNGVVIGRFCWIGMNVVILPNVRLGDHTIVAAGSVVTKPFPNGYCVLAGIPAKVVKILDSHDCKSDGNEHQYVGYYKKDYFLRNMRHILDRIYDPISDSFITTNC